MKRLLSSILTMVVLVNFFLPTMSEVYAMSVPVGNGVTSSSDNNINQDDQVGESGKTILHSTMDVKNIQTIDSRSELKDIQKTTVYREVSGALETVTTIDSNNLSQYLVKIEMKDLPTTYAKIQSFDASTNKIQLEMRNFVTIGENGGTLDGAYIEWNQGTSNPPQNNSNPYIPNYDRLKANVGFNASKEILYSNLFQLNPFLKSESYLELGKNIPVDDILNKKTIRYIFPIVSGKHQVDVTTGNYHTIDSIQIVFQDDTSAIMKLSTPRMEDSILTFATDYLNIPYTYDKYVIDTSSTIVHSLRDSIKDVTYEKDLLPLVGGRDIDNNSYTEDGSQTFTDSDYNMLDDTAALVISQNDVFINKLLSSDLNFNTNLNDNVLSLVIKSELNQNTLNSYLYSYIYFRNWYHVDFDSIYLADLIMFHSKYYSEGFDVAKIIDIVVKTDRENRNSNRTHLLYSREMALYTNIPTIGEFIDHHIKVFTGQTNYSKWFTDYFKGVVVERSVDNLPNVEYTVYDNLKSVRSGAFLLPALAYNLEDMYLLAVPTQLVYGSLMAYPEYKNGSGRAALTQKLNQMADGLAKFYKTSSNLVDNPEEKLNGLKQLQVDTFLEADNRWVTPPNSTIPTKNKFYDAVKIGIQPKHSTAGYAVGDMVAWVRSRFIGSISTATHEITHNQDKKYLLNGKGARYGVKPEDLAKGMFEQGTGLNSATMNFITEHSVDSDKLGPLDPDRIDSNEEMKDYYQKFYEAIYSIDLLEAQALLELEPEVQRRMLYQHHVGSDKTTGTWSPISNLGQYQALNIKSPSDLTKNRLNITRGIEPNSELPGMNSYIASDYNSALFYTPYNDEGRADAYTFKRFGYELAAINGYKHGFVRWIGYLRDDDTIVHNDIDAIRYATGDDTMTFEKFDLNKYKDVAAKLDTSEYFDKEQVIEMFKYAFLADYKSNDYQNKARSGNLRTALMRGLNRQTNDFQKSIYAPKEVLEVSSAQQLINEIHANPAGNYRLTNDLDFLGITSGESSYITKTFVGSVDGNGFTIRNLSNPLFARLKYANIKDLKFDNATLLDKTKDEVGILSKRAEYSFLTNIHVTNSFVTGRDYVGGLIGVSQKDTLNKISVEARIIVEQVPGIRLKRAGGILAHAFSTTLANAYTTGYINSATEYAGGVVGEIELSTIDHVYSNMYITADWYIGGILGVTKDPRSIVQNSISIGDGGSSSRSIDGYSDDSTILKAYEGTYEYAQAKIETSLAKRLGSTHSSKINTVELNDLKNSDFYITQLGFDPNIWDFSKLSSDILPTFQSVSIESPPLLLNTTSSFYQIEEYKEDKDGNYSSTPSNIIIKRGKADSNLTITPASYDGFMVDGSNSKNVLTGTIGKINETPTTFKVYYNRGMYTVNFDTNGGSIIGDQTDIPFGSKLTKPMEPTKNGFVFSGWYKDTTFTEVWDFDKDVITSDTTLYAKWIMQGVGEATYQVEHYKQNVELNGYSVAETETLTGTISDTVIAQPKTYSGFVFSNNHNDQVRVGVVSSDNGLTLKLYYDRQRYQVSFNTNGGNIIAPQTNVPFGSTIAKPTEPTKAGFVFLGWYKDSAFSSVWEFDTDEITKNTTLYAKWQVDGANLAGYKVEHYKQNKEQNGYDLSETESLTGTIGDTVTAKSKSYAEFVLDKNHSDQVGTGVVSSDGSLTLKLYYNRVVTSGVTSVAIMERDVFLEPGDSQNFTVSVQGTGTYSDEVLWSLEGSEAHRDTKIDENGLLTVSPDQKKGTFLVKATSKGDNTIFDTVTVEVEFPTITSVNVEPGSKVMSPGDSYTFKALVKGTGHFDDGVEWTLEGSPVDSDTQVQSDGTVQVGMNESEVRLTLRATSKEDSTYSATATIHVKTGEIPAEVTQLSITPEDAKLYPGDELQFEVIVFGNGDYDPSVEFLVEGSKLDPSTTIGEDGMLTIGEDQKKTTLKVWALSKADPTKKVSAKVTVFEEEASISNVTVSPQQGEMRAGGRQQFKAKVTGGGNVNPSVSWVLEGEVSDTGTRLTEDGLLIVGSKEKNTTLTVRAVSVEDSMKSGAAVITVKATNRPSGGGSSGGGGSSSGGGGGSSSGGGGSIVNATKPKPEPERQETIGSWKSEEKGWKFLKADGSAVKNEWVLKGGEWYYPDEAGYLKTGWLEKDGTWYYLNKSDGSMEEGWVVLNGIWYYLRADGSWDEQKQFAVETIPVEGVGSWIREMGGWSFVDSSNNRLTSQWIQVSGVTYYVGANGLIHQGWLDLDGKRYYMDDVTGAMESGSIFLDGQWYNL